MWTGMVCLGHSMKNVRIKISCKDPRKIPFERLIEMKKKLFLIGFIVEGFEQMGGKNCMVEIEDENEDDDLEEDNGNQEPNDLSKNIDDDELIDDETAIDDLDKANFKTQGGTSSSSKKKMSNTLSEYQGGGQEKLNMMDMSNKKSVFEIEVCEGIYSKSVDVTSNKTEGICTPEKTWTKKDDAGNQSGYVDYCMNLLSSVDMSVSDDEEYVEEVDVGVLSPGTVQKFQESGIKRSLLETLDQARSGGIKVDKNLKWGPVKAQKYGTRVHGNVDIIKNTAQYKMKKIFPYQ